MFSRDGTCKCIKTIEELAVCRLFTSPKGRYLNSHRFRDWVRISDEVRTTGVSTLHSWHIIIINIIIILGL